MRISLFTGAIVASVLASSVAASQVGYVCELQERSSSDGFLGTPLVIILDPDGMDAMVSDPLVLRSFGKPISAKSRVTNAGKHRLRWQVRDFPVTDGKIKVDYRALFDPADNSVSVNGSIRGAGNRIRGTGACQELKNSQMKDLLKR